MSTAITYTKCSGGYKAIYHNGVEMGSILMGEDGFYAWWAIKRDGYQQAWTLRAIADKLDALNEDYQEELERFFDEDNKQ